MYVFSRCSRCSAVGLVLLSGDPLELCRLCERGSGESDRAERVTVPSVLLVLIIGGAVRISPGERKSKLADLLLLVLRGFPFLERERFVGDEGCSMF